MKRGVHFTPTDPVVPVSCHGIPVVYDNRSKQFAQACGLFADKRIVLGPMFFMLNQRERQAFLLHEVGHCRAFHLEIRLLFILLFWTKWARRLCARQEMQADAFAVKEGYGIDLLSGVVRFTGGEGPFYPTLAERAANIRRLLKESIHAVAA